MWDAIDYPFQNLNVATVDVWEKVSDFIPHVTGHVITYPSWNYSLSMFVKGPPGTILVMGM